MRLINIFLMVFSREFTIFLFITSPKVKFWELMNNYVRIKLINREQEKETIFIAEKLPDGECEL